MLLVAPALATPVLSFYAVEIAAWRRRRAAGAETKRLGRPLALAAVLTLAAAAAGATHVETRYAPEYREWARGAKIFVGQTTYLLIAQGLLFMIAFVFAGHRRSVWLWTGCTAVTAICVFLLW